MEKLMEITKHVFATLVIALLAWTPSAFAVKHCWCTGVVPAPEFACSWSGATDPVFKDYGAIQQYKELKIGANYDCEKRCGSLVMGDAGVANAIDATPHWCNYLRETGRISANTADASAGLCFAYWVGTGGHTEYPLPNYGAAICQKSCPAIEGIFNIKNAGLTPLVTASDRVDVNSHEYYDEYFSPFIPGQNQFHTATCGALLEQYECVYQLPVPNAPDQCFGLNRGVTQFQGSAYATNCGAGLVHKDGGSNAVHIYKRKYEDGHTDYQDVEFDSCVTPSNPIKGSKTAREPELQTRSRNGVKQFQASASINILPKLVEVTEGPSPKVRSVASDGSKPAPETKKVYRMLFPTP